MILCSINFNPGYRLVNNEQWPQIADGFAHTYRTVAALRPDIWLAPHTFMFGLTEKYARLQASPGTNPYLDPEGFAAYVAARRADFLDEFARQAQPR